MSSLLTQLGLGPASNLHTSGFLIWNWWYAYGMLSSRTMKQYYGVDHNKAPRQDSSESCEEAVKDGRLSRRTLDMIKRTEAASANSVEGYTLFVAAVLFAMVAKLPNQTVNRYCASYTLARLLYGPAYIFVESENLAVIRSVAWWWGNISCLALLWKGGNALLAASSLAVY